MDGVDSVHLMEFFVQQSVDFMLKYRLLASGLFASLIAHGYRIQVCQQNQLCRIVMGILSFLRLRQHQDAESQTLFITPVTETLPQSYFSIGTAMKVSDNAEFISKLTEEQ